VSDWTPLLLVLTVLLGGPFAACAVLVANGDVS